MAESNDAKAKDDEKIRVELLQAAEIEGEERKQGERVDIPARKLNRLVELGVVKKVTGDPERTPDFGGADVAPRPAADKTTAVRNQPAADRAAKE